MKRIRKAAAVLFMLCMLLPHTAAATEISIKDGYTALTGSGALPAAAEARVQPQLSYDAAAVLLGEASTGKVLYEEAADEQRPIASITKVMTMLLTFEAVEEGRIALDDVVTASEHAYSMGGSQIWLEPGETMTVHELLKAVAVASANDAAVALAEHVAGSEDAFVARMNQKAAELGMQNTVFKNSNGLDEPGHLSTARDVFTMSCRLLEHELVRGYVSIWMDQLREGETQLVNTNKLLNSYKGMTGLKTGSTSGAGICISASAERDGMELVAVVLGSPDSKTRFEAAKTLLDHGFANYELVPLALPQDAAEQVRVKLGKQRECSYTSSMPESMVVPKGMAGSLVVDMTLADSVSAPVEQGQVLGEADVYLGSELKAAYPLYASAPVEKIDFATAFVLLLKSLCSIGV